MIKFRDILNEDFAYNNDDRDKLEDYVINHNKSALNTLLYDKGIKGTKGHEPTEHFKPITNPIFRGVKTSPVELYKILPTWWTKRSQYVIAPTKTKSWSYERSVAEYVIADSFAYYFQSGDIGAILVYNPIETDMFIDLTQFPEYNKIGGSAYEKEVLCRPSGQVTIQSMYLTRDMQARIETPHVETENPKLINDFLTYKKNGGRIFTLEGDGG